MAKKPKSREAKSRRSNTKPATKRRQKLVLGGVILVLVLAGRRGHSLLAAAEYTASPAGRPGR